MQGPMVQGYCPTGTSVQLAEILSCYKQRPYSLLSSDSTNSSFWKRPVTSVVSRPECALTPGRPRP
jgi:hypothetical protein